MSNAPKVWMNGELVPADEVRVSPFDLGLAVGWGAFETMAGYHGKVFAFLRHYERLKYSASVMAIHVPAGDVLLNAIAEVIHANDLDSGRARIRVALSGGSYPLHGVESGETRGNVLVTAVAMDAPVKRVSLSVSPFPHNERSGLSGCKSTSYGNNLMALRHAVAEGADEALMMNTAGQLCECATANIFLVADGEIRTPSLASGCLAGVTRGVVLELAREHGMAAEERDLAIEDIEHADEIFLTSSTREVQSAVMLGRPKAGAGELTDRLAGFYQQRVRRELGL